MVLEFGETSVQKEVLKHWCGYTDAEGNVLDAVIAPVFPNVAAKHETTKYWTYTSQWNLLDYPVLAFPVTKVDESLDQPYADYTPLNELDKYFYEQYDSPSFVPEGPSKLVPCGFEIH